MLLFALLTLSHPAYAVCVPFFTNPEDGVDGCDDDGDGSLAVRRPYINTMNVPAIPGLFDFTLPTGAGVVPVGVVQIVQGGGNEDHGLEPLVVAGMG